MFVCLFVFAIFFLCRDDERQLADSRQGGGDRKERHVPTSLQVDELRVLPTFEAAFGSEREATEREANHDTEEEEVVVEAEEVREFDDDAKKPTFKGRQTSQDRPRSQTGDGGQLQKIDGQDIYVADDISDLIRQASRTTSLAVTPAPGKWRTEGSREHG